MKKTLLALALSTFTASALALEPMPQEAGFSGSFGLGAAGGSVESNFLAEIFGIDLSDDKIHQDDSPSETTIIIPNFDFNVNYTFANKKTLIRLGDAVESAIDFSANTALGVRHEFSTLGSIQLDALLPTPGVEVWEDPYLTGEKRSSTERDSTGGQITWDGIFGSGFEFIASTREIDLEDEHSGEGPGLDASQRDLLDREGDVTRVELGYMFNCGGGDIKVRPSIAYIDRDLDGDAMSQDGYELGVQLLYNAGSYVWLNRAAYQSLDGDADNPIFGKANDADVYVLASEVRIPEPFGWDKWTTSVGVSWGENSADIDFNKSSVALFSARLGRSF
jgi:hypothetical protein